MIPRWLIAVLWLVSLALLAAMVAVSWVHLMPGGQLILDSRITGYDVLAVSDYIDALGPLGIAKYVGPLHTLDTVFPAVLAITLAACILVAARGLPTLTKFLLLLAPAAYGLADYAENMFVLGLLRSWQGTLDPEMVLWSSRLTVTKFAALGVTGAILVRLMTSRRRQG